MAIFDSNSVNYYRNLFWDLEQFGWKKYIENQKLTIKKETIKNGDKFQVNYSEKNPEYSELIFEKRIK